ncbi:hypothetical protein [Streptomyces sp. NPDC005859]|uniref:hypothetical protein n=1 Tax=Streptomyces sp. NPDC005859 TaxID=3157170 RepID=UPI0033BFCD04
MTADTLPPRPPIVVLCGSTRFWDALAEAALYETTAGRIVLAPTCDLKTPHPLWADPARADRLKHVLDDLHLRKIDLADDVLIVNVNVRLSSPSPRSPRAVPPILRSAPTVLRHPQG